MASSWIREVQLQAGTQNTGVPFITKLYSLYLYRVLGYTVSSQNVTGGQSFITTSKAGTNGSFAGGTLNFVDSTANSFVVGDSNSWIIIKDGTNQENSGIYKATYSSASTISIDYRAAAGAEYPTASTGLSWWLLAEDYDTPNTDDDYIRLITPHSYAWSIQLTLRSLASATDRRLDVSVCTDGSWSATIPKTIGPVCWGMGGTNDASLMYYNLEADVDGKWINLWGIDSGGTVRKLIILSHIIPYHSLYDSEELVVLLGNKDTSTDYNTSCIARDMTSDQNISYGYMWCNDVMFQVNSCIIEWTYNIAAGAATPLNNSFATYVSREVNARTGNEDVHIGTPILLDYKNNYGFRHTIGYMFSTFTCRSALGDKTTFQRSTSQDTLHITSGFAVEWPGLTPQV